MRKMGEVRTQMRDRRHSQAPAARLDSKKINGARHCHPHPTHQ